MSLTKDVIFTKIGLVKGTILKCLWHTPIQNSAKTSNVVPLSLFMTSNDVSKDLTYFANVMFLSKYFGIRLLTLFQ